MFIVEKEAELIVSRARDDKEGRESAILMVVDPNVIETGVIRKTCCEEESTGLELLSIRITNLNHELSGLTSFGAIEARAIGLTVLGDFITKFIILFFVIMMRIIAS
jgi:hypothetical protein